MPSEIEVRQGDRIIWTRNDKALGIANGSQVEVVGISGQSHIVRDAVAERTLAPGNPLRESVAHGLVLNMHRAQGLTVARAITVLDSNDRQLNSASLYTSLHPAPDYYDRDLKYGSEDPTDPAKTRRKLYPKDRRIKFLVGMCSAPFKFRRSLSHLSQ